MHGVLKQLAWSVLALFGAILLVLAAWIGPMLYRVYVGLDRYETVPPALPSDLGDRAILIFSKTNGFRDGTQIDAANAALIAAARHQGWTPFATENGAVFDPQILHRFRAVVWNSVSGDVLTPAQRAAFKTWLEHGGGFVGLHGAGGDLQYAWPWYANDVIGARFIGHTLGPQIQPATLRIEDRNHPATLGLGASWTRSDEWYSFASSPRALGYHILVTIDERSYRPAERLLPFLPVKDIRMGRDHPMIWTHCVGDGRVFYSALGHTAASYAEPQYIRMLTGAIAWAAGYDGPTCDRRPPPELQ